MDDKFKNKKPASMTKTKKDKYWREKEKKY